MLVKPPFPTGRPDMTRIVSEGSRPVLRHDHGIATLIAQNRKTTAAWESGLKKQNDRQRYRVAGRHDRNC
jgi:hypothetical protein